MPAKPPYHSAKTTRTPLKYSVRVRITVGLLSIMIAFVGLSFYSIFLHRRTVAHIELINDVYLPLTHGTEEIRSTQLVFNTLMDRLPEDAELSATRDWLGAARRFRPRRLSRLIRQVAVSLRQGDFGDEEDFLRAIRRRLRAVQRHYIRNESQFLTLYELMDTGRIDKARFQVESLKRVERALDRQIAEIGQDIKDQITALSLTAARDGTRATLGLALLTGLTFLFAVAIVAFSNRLLFPLKTLRDAVEKVARGELQTHIDVTSPDEFGDLAIGFNRMTDALVERDLQLIRSERLAAAGRMAAQVTHEIRNPLSSLGLNAEMLEEDLLSGSVDKSEAKALLSAMQMEIERLTGITESYLRFARLPSPEPTFNDLNELVQAALDFMASEFLDQRISLDSQLSPQLPKLLFDKNQIRQALINLLRNAGEAIVNQGEIIVSTSLQADSAKILVTDTGGGIPDAAVDKIFESFFSTRSGGTGLGLPMVKQICLAHGGDITLERTDNTGSTFVMALPLSTDYSSLNPKGDISDGKKASSTS